MKPNRDFLQKLGVRYPLIQAPMGGGCSTPAMAVAVCEAGGLGTLAAAYLSPEDILQATAEIRRGTGRAFGVNLFAPLPVPPRPTDTLAALEALQPVHAELGLPPPQLPQQPMYSFDEQLAACLEGGPAVFSFTFGLLPASAADAIKARGCFLIGTATTVNEAIALHDSGVDAVVAQGAEAGAHRGTFAVSFAEGLIGTMALVPQVVDAVPIPVIASGGIMDGRGVVAALALGASAVQMGTAFLTTDEAMIPAAYKEALLTTAEDRTRITTAFSGRAARGIVNHFMEQAESSPNAILPYPWQNALTRPMRTAAAKAGRAEYLSLWAGQGVRLARRTDATALVQRVMAEAKTIAARLSM
jgi:nitronate monooxygenase